MSCVITIDGPTGSGKSTVCRMLAERLNYRYLDTGAMYRAIGLAIWRAGIDIENEEAVERICKDADIRLSHQRGETRVYLCDEDVTKAIREPLIDIMASDVSTLQSVRRMMAGLQRTIGAQGPLVAEGRDMGTVVFPKAKHKFFLDASLEVRVDRRFQERKNRGETISRERVKEDLIKRDEQDMNRRFAPLKPARDAKLIDTTHLNLQQVVERVIHELKKKKKFRFLDASK
ncbi:MAG: (d)CMP kinase [Deltaproteobacteria bacterium]|nr:(d)CMP kinase [Deltaproteobacteria bacterium]